MNARDRILERVREANVGRERVEHPGPFEGPRPPGASVSFRTAFTAAGGEFVQVADVDAARAWLADFVEDVPSLAHGTGVPARLLPDRPVTPPEDAALGISLALGAVAETGSLLLSSADGRRPQLLPPVHVVLVPASGIAPTLREALLDLPDRPWSAVGLHSGPSKSADIGQILVKGVHGPGRLIALVVEEGLEE